MRLLFIGDIFGRTGREMVQDYLPRIKQKYNIDLVIANAENSAHGKGISMRVYEDLTFNGIDVLTMGNHTFAKKELLNIIDDMPRMVIPSNIHSSLPGIRSGVFTFRNFKVRVTSILGAIHMHPGYRPPFETMEAILKVADEDLHIVDFHAETTSEKNAFGQYFSGKVSAILGTHTHVQTADEKIINGTAYITDVGMTGPYDSVIGCKKEVIIDQMRSGLMQRFEPMDGKGQLSAVVIDFDGFKATKIERILISPDHLFED